MIIQGLSNMLSNYNYITVTGTYMDGNELLGGLEKEVPDILLLDIQLPGHTGDELVPMLGKRYPEMKIIILTNFNSVVYATNLLRLGVSGYLLKTAREHTIIEAIESVHKGVDFVDPALREKIAQQNQRAKSAVLSRVTLTTREKEILNLIIKGYTNQEIVSTLFLSINTVKNYRKSIFLKLDVKNMAELTNKVLTMGLTD
jgi:DNA-binding NarL/FixJ family response regulator